MSFDVVVPVGPNDVTYVRNPLSLIRKNVVGCRNIYVVTSFSEPYEGCITVQESKFPFSIEDVAAFHGNNPRNGWYLQQLLKLYAGFAIEGILDRYLVVDADTCFLRPTTFVEGDICLYNYGIENHPYYFEHMNLLHETLGRVDPQKSGICHHMMFEKQYLKELFDLVEKKHGTVFWKVFLSNVAYPLISGASEYEIYFNFMLKYHEDKIKIRALKWKNDKDMSGDYDYVSCHWYIR